VILKVARLGHPVVRTRAEPLDPASVRSRPIQRLIDDMIETMHEYEGVGLAAPQVHVSLRLAVIEVPASDERARDAVPLSVLINPKLTPRGKGAALGFEGCLSIPELRGAVPRLKRLRLDALDRQGRPYSLEAEGFHARVIQHECDHLDGRVYLDRMDGLKSLAFLPEFERFTLPAHDEPEPE
jgi:peptide deformylase